MTWTCRLIEVEDRERRCDCGTPECPVYLYSELVDKATGKAPVVGDMWESDWYAREANPQYLSPQYRAEFAHLRKPLVVVLPGGRQFCVDSVYINEGGLLGATGWTVSGEPPVITLQPSINAKGSYHGFLTAGVLSADVDGRVYTADGSRVLP